MASDRSDRLCRVFFSLICSVPRLAELFQQWCTLDEEEKSELDNVVMDVLGEDYLARYSAIREALMRWDIVQDTEGAPGFTKYGIFDHFITDETEPEVMKVVKTIEQFIKQITEAKCNLYNSYQETEMEEFLEISDKPIVFMHALRRTKSINNLLEPSSAKYKKYRMPLALRIRTNTVAELNYDTE
ncbi:hypothetical protein CBL_11507 [Carabus blaptoides fortunei]